MIVAAATAAAPVTSDIIRMLEILETQTEPMGNWSLEQDPHRSNYETVAQYLGDRDVDADEFESAGAKEKAIRTNRLVRLQWYPRNPVGFNLYFAPDLESLAAWFVKEHGL